MTKKEWLQALLDGKTVTSNYANGNPIIFYEGVFIYKNTSEVVNLNLHNHGLREYFEYSLLTKEVTMEDIEAHYGCKVKIVVVA